MFPNDFYIFPIIWIMDVEIRESSLKLNQNFLNCPTFAAILFLENENNKIKEWYVDALQRALGSEKTFGAQE